MKGLTCAAVLLLAAGSALAQEGRAGATWQTEIDLAKEQRAAFLVENEGLTAEEWAEAALARVHFVLTDTDLTLRELAHFHDAVADKKAVTEKAGGAVEKDEVDDYFGLDIGGAGEAREEVWTIRFAKKPPRTLTLTLTDPDSSEIDCSMKDLEAVGSGYIGIFEYEFELLCIPRGN